MEIFGVKLGKINGNNMDKEDKKLLLGYIDKVGVIEKYLESLRVVNTNVAFNIFDNCNVCAVYFNLILSL